MISDLNTVLLSPSDLAAHVQHSANTPEQTSLVVLAVTQFY